MGIFDRIRANLPSPLITASGGGGAATSVLATDGTSSAPSISFAADTNTGIYRIGADDMGFVAGGFLGMDVKKSTGNFANVAFGGGAASSSDIYAMIIARDQAQNTSLAITNVEGSASAVPSISLIGDTGATSMGDITLWPAAQSLASYANRMAIHSAGTSAGLSFVAAGAAGSDVRFYTNGGAAANEVLRLTDSGALATEVRFKGSTSGYTGLKAGATPSSVTFTLPAADGTAGQALTTTGGGVLAFATISGGSAAGSTGALQFNNAGAFAADASNLFWDNSNKRLGIGTSSPGSVNACSLDIVLPNGVAYALLASSAFNDIVGRFTAGSHSLVYGASFGGGTFLGSETGDNFNIRTNNAVCATFDTQGRLGINQPSPTQKLHVVGSIRMVDGNEGSNKVLRSAADGTASWFAGASGTFTTADAKTVTVVNGLITSIV